MKKWILVVLISAMSIGVAADSAHAIFGGMAWRVNARRNGSGFFSGRRGRIIKAAPAIRKQTESINPAAPKVASGVPLVMAEIESIVAGEIKEWDIPVTILSSSIFPDRTGRYYEDGDYKNVVKEAPYEYHEWLHGYQTRGGQ